MTEEATTGVCEDVVGTVTSGFAVWLELAEVVAEYVGVALATLTPEDCDNPIDGLLLVGSTW